MHLKCRLKTYRLRKPPQNIEFQSIFKHNHVIFIDFPVRTSLQESSTADTLTAGQVAPQARQTRRNKLMSGDVNNGDAKKVAEFSPEIHCRSLFLTDFFAYLHCSAPSTWSKIRQQQKMLHTQTESGPIRGPAGPVFGHPKRLSARK